MPNADTPDTSRSPKDVGSVFVSLPGVLVLLVFTILSAYFSLGPVTVFLFIMLLIAATSRLWGRHALSHLEASCDMEVTRAFPGTGLELEVTVRNAKALPLIWVRTDLFDSFPPFLSPQEAMTRKESWVMSYSAVSWSTSFTGTGRGVVLLDHVNMTSGDGFGLMSDSGSYELEQGHLIVIYPHVFAVNSDALIRDTLDLHPGQRGFLEDNTLLKGNRDYEAGDSSRFINWRVLARQQKMTVNLFETVIPLTVTFVLDLKSFSRWEETSTSSGSMTTMTEFHSSKMEDMISLVASLILELTQRKVKCALLLPLIEYVKEDGSKTVSKGRFVQTDIMDDQVPLLLETLSRINYSGQHSVFISQEVQGVSHMMGQCYVVSESADSLTCTSMIDSIEEHNRTLIVHDMSESATRTLGMGVLSFQELRRQNG